MYQIGFVKHIVLLLVTLIIMSVFCPNAFCIPKVRTKAKQAIVMDYNTGRILFEKNKDDKVSPSSMMKMIIAYIVFSELENGRIKMSDTCLVSKKAWGMPGSRMFLSAGSKVSFEDLLNGLITQSGNDAAVTIAECISGDESSFVSQMNAVAKLLGLESTRYVNATGLHNPKQYMSMYDIAKLSSALLADFPQYYSLFGKKTFKYANINQQNRNTLLGEFGVDGIKTGYTDSGGYGISVSARDANRRVIVVVNGLSSALGRIREAKKLVNFGLMNFKNTVIYPPNAPLAKAKVWYGEKYEVDLVAHKSIELTTSVAGGSTQDVEVAIEYTSPLVAPLSKDAPVGCLIINSDDESIQNSVAIYPAQDVERGSVLKKVVQNLSAIFSKYISYS